MLTWLTACSIDCNIKWTDANERTNEQATTRHSLFIRHVVFFCSPNIKERASLVVAQLNSVSNRIFPWRCTNWTTNQLEEWKFCVHESSKSKSYKSVHTTWHQKPFYSPFKKVVSIFFSSSSFRMWDIFL